MSMMTEKRRQLARRLAKVWQNYFEMKDVLPGITLSKEQMSVVLQDEEHLLIQGAAGSGKSITLLYKMLKVMEQEEERKRILYCSFNLTLVHHAIKLFRQANGYDRLKDKHEVHFCTFHSMAENLLKRIGLSVRSVKLSSQNELTKYEDTVLRRVAAVFARIKESPKYQQLPPSQKLYTTHTDDFLKEEILWMKANGFVTEDAYLNCERIGRGHHPRLTREQRQTIFAGYQEYQEDLKRRFHGDMDLEDYALLLWKHMDEIPDHLKYDYVFVDEVQDLQPMQLKTLVALAKQSIVLAGDSRQRIYKRTPFSYKELGLHIEGKRNRMLHTNFRSTRQIMQLAESLRFVDEEGERIKAAYFPRNGPKPQIRYFSSDKAHNRFIIRTIKEKWKEDPEKTVALIHRFDGDIFQERNSKLFYDLNREFELITTEQYGKRFDPNKPKKPVFFTDAFSVKGLEFDIVFVLHFDRFHYPNERRMKELEKRTSGDKFAEAYIQDEEQILNEEKKVLYVAMTRAKEELYLLYCNNDPIRISQFVRDFPCEYFEAHGFNKSKYCK